MLSVGTPPLHSRHNRDMKSYKTETRHRESTKEAIAGSKNPIAAGRLSTKTSSRTQRIRSATGNRLALTVTQPLREAPPHDHVHATCCLDRIVDSQRAS